ITVQGKMLRMAPRPPPVAKAPPGLAARIGRTPQADPTDADDAPAAGRARAPRVPVVHAVRAGPAGRRHRVARSMAVGRAAFRAGCKAHGRVGRLAVPASRPRTVFGQAADAVLAAGRGLRGCSQLARRVPAALAAGRPAHARPDLGSRSPLLEP